MWKRGSDFQENEYDNSHKLDLKWDQGIDILCRQQHRLKPHNAYVEVRLQTKPQSLENRGNQTVLERNSQVDAEVKLQKVSYFSKRKW